MHSCAFCGQSIESTTKYKITEPNYNHPSFYRGMPVKDIPKKSYYLPICNSCRPRQEASDKKAGLNPQ